MLRLSEIKAVHVEITTRCNARCPMCPRNLRGFDYNSGYPITELSLDEFKSIFSPEFLGPMSKPDLREDGVPMDPQLWFKGFKFNGNLGDFSAARDGAEIVKYLADHGVAVQIYTNGSARNEQWWAGLALPRVEIGFALDGLEDTHHLYRQDTDWKKVIKNARSFIQAGGRAIWRFIPFDHNRHQEDRCRDLAQELGFAKFENIYDGRSKTPVFHRNGSFSHQIGRFQPRPPDIATIIKDHESWFDHRVIRIAKDTPELDLRCTHKMSREIYLAADGTVYPCCYLGFYPETMKHAGNEQVKSIAQENNALVYGLEHAMTWFDRVEQSWSRSSIPDGRLYACVNHCNQSVQKSTH
jgi:MoaA/NifB/PqqE/SkfB family radical SAM enzyme